MRTEWNWKRNTYRTRSQGQSIKINQTKVKKHEIHKGSKNNNGVNLRIAIPAHLSESCGTPGGDHAPDGEREKGEVNGLTGRLEGAAQKNLKL